MQDITKPKNLGIKIILGAETADFGFSNISPPPPAAATGKDILFSADIPYNQAEIGAMDRQRKLEFLFNPAVFTDCMRRWNKTPTDAKTPGRNIQTTLAMLWSNTFPLKNNLHVSSDLIEGTTTKFAGEANPGALAQFNRLMQKAETGAPPYAAIKQGDQIYTLQKATWLNEVANNPLYRPLLQAIYAYDIWTKFKSTAVLKKEFDLAWTAFKKLKPDVGAFLDQTASVVSQVLNVSQSAALQASVAPIDQIKGVFAGFRTELANFDATLTPTAELYNSLRVIYENIEAIQEPSMKSQFTNAFSLVKPLYSILRVWVVVSKGGIFVGTDEFLQKVPEYKTLREEMDKFDKTVARCDNLDLNEAIKAFFTPLGETSPLQNIAGYVCHNLLKYGETVLNKYIAERAAALPPLPAVVLNYAEPADLKTGLIFLKDGKMTIYVCLDAVKAEITPENRGKYSCPVKGEVLGELSEVLLGMKYAGNTYEVVSHIIGPVLDETPGPAPTPAPGIPPPAAPAPAAAAKGGRRRTRRRVRRTKVGGKSRRHRRRH